MQHLGPMSENHDNGACNRRIQIRVCVYIYMYIHHIYLCAYDRGIPRHPLRRCLPETQHYLLSSCAALVRIFPRPSVAQLAARFKILGFRAQGSGLRARGSGLRVQGGGLGFGVQGLGFRAPGFTTHAPRIFITTIQFPGLDVWRRLPGR